MKLRTTTSLVTSMSALLLAGCASMPVSGSVHEGVELPVNQPGVDLIADGPQGGETPEQIIDSFLLAQAAWQTDGFAGAESFLTAEALGQWIPLEGVMVHSGNPRTQLVEVELDDDGEPVTHPIEEVDPEATRVSIDLQVSTIANVTPDGVRTEMDPRDGISMRFELALDDDGEWRIDELPNGIIVSQANFNTIYQRVPLYFLSFDSRYLVPEFRWVPSQESASYVVQALAEGPSEIWAPVLHTAFPARSPGTALTVEVEQGVARVELPSVVTALEPDARSYLFSQFDHSLRHLSGINRVELQYNGQPIALGEPAEVTVNPAMSDVLFTLEAEGLYSLSAGSPTLIRGELPEEWLTASDLVVNVHGAVEAVVNEDRTMVTFSSGTGGEDVILEGENISDISRDRFGWSWFSMTREVQVPSVAEDPSDDDLLEPGDDDGTQADDPEDTFEYESVHSLMAVHRDGRVVSVTQPWVTSGAITSVAVSRDGSRIAAITEAEGVHAIELAGVERDNEGAPRSVGTSTRQGRALRQPVDIEWINDSSLAVVAESSLTGRQSVHEVLISGSSESLPNTFDAIESVVVVNGTQSLYVLLPRGELNQLVGWVWQSTREEVLWAGFPH